MSKKIVVFGDSHSEIFRHMEDGNAYKAIVVPGTTAQGCINPNGKSNGLQIFKQKVSEIDMKEYDYFIIHVGEVDCNYLIWYQMKYHGKSMEDILQRCVHNIFVFIEEYVRSSFEPSHIIVSGPTLPKVRDYKTLSPDAKWGARLAITETIEERTALTLKFCKRLQEECRLHNYKYVDVNEFLIDKDTGILQSVYLDTQPEDIHFPPYLIKDIYKKELAKVYT